MTFSVVTRRTSSSLSPSPLSTGSSDNTSSSLSSLTRLRGAGRPPKRRRGRPRKDEPEAAAATVEGIEDDCKGDNDRHTINPSKRSVRSFDNSHSPSKKSNWTTASDEDEASDNDVTLEEEEESPICDNGSDRKRKNRLFNHAPAGPSPKRRNLTLVTQRELGEKGTGHSTKKHVVQPAAIVDGDVSAITHPLCTLNPSINIEGGKECDPSTTEINGEGSTATPPTTIAQDPTYSTNGSSSGGSLVDSEVLVHSLRPRSSLLPPPQFRDESYDMKVDRPMKSLASESKPSHLPPSIKAKTNQNKAMSTAIGISIVHQQATTATATTNNNTSTGTDNVPATSGSSNMASPVKTVGGVTVTKLPLANGSPIVYKSSKSLSSPVDITRDVKELLKAYLSCLQATAAKSEFRSEAIKSHLESHLIDERQFMDLLFCFMKMRKTPIHRVPRLGSRNCKLLSV